MLKVYFLRLKKRSWSKADEELLNLISKERAEKIRRKVRGEGRRLSLYSALLLRFALSKALKISASSFEFELEKNGKPILKNLEGTVVDFNFSHTQGAVLLGLSDIGGIGVDLEYAGKDGRKAPFKVMKRLFCDEEIAYVKKTEDGKSERFFEIWTAKEAYLKAKGSGFVCKASEVNTLLEEAGRNITTWNEGAYTCSVCLINRQGIADIFAPAELIRLDEEEVIKRI